MEDEEYDPTIQPDLPPTGPPKKRNIPPKPLDEFTRRYRFRPKRSPDQQRQDRELMSRLIHEEGLQRGELYHRVITDRYAPKDRVTMQAFAKDLKHLRELWDKNSIRHMQSIKSQKLQEVLHLKKLYYAGYYRSLGRMADPESTDKNAMGYREVTTQEDDFRIMEIARAKAEGKPPPSDRKRVRYKREELLGSKVWLDGVSWCIEMELKIRWNLSTRPNAGYLGSGSAKRHPEDGADVPTEDDSALEQGLVLPPDKIAGQQVFALLKEAEEIEKQRDKVAAGLAAQATAESEHIIDGDFTDIK